MTELTDQQFLDAIRRGMEAIHRRFAAKAKRAKRAAAARRTGKSVTRAARQLRRR